MHEKLISFEVAILAAQKKFNWPTLYYFWENKELALDMRKSINSLEDHIQYKYKKFIKDNNSIKKINTISLPTQSLLQKWLRNDKKTNIIVEQINNDYKIKIIKIGPKNKNDILFYNGRKIEISNIIFNSYEEALEYGLYYTLKHFLK